MLGGLRMLLNILQTKKNADFKLQMAAGAALFNICDGDGTSLSLILEYVRSYILLPSNNPVHRRAAGEGKGGLEQGQEHTPPGTGDPQARRSRGRLSDSG